MPGRMPSSLRASGSLLVLRGQRRQGTIGVRRGHSQVAGGSGLCTPPELVRGFYERGVRLPQVERAIWLGCIGKNPTLNCAAVIDEVVSQSNTPESHWAYLELSGRSTELRCLSRHVQRLEQLPAADLKRGGTGTHQ